MNRTRGLPTGLQLHLTINNGNQYQNKKHGTNLTTVNNNTRSIATTRPHASMEAPHIQDHNIMVVVHHLPPRRTGIVPGVTGMRISTGVVHRGEA